MRAVRRAAFRHCGICRSAIRMATGRSRVSEALRAAGLSEFKMSGGDYRSNGYLIAPDQPDRFQLSFPSVGRAECLWRAITE
jgi:hypothetical protein